MRELGGVFLALTAVISYFILATQFAIYQRWPWIHFLLGFGACAILVWSVFKRSGRRRLLAALALTCTLAITGCFLWWTLDFSTYPSSAAAVMVGEDLGPELAELRFLSHSGKERAALQPGDRGTLLVFYRGYW